jgi:hypothetical protein
MQYSRRTLQQSVFIRTLAGVSIVAGILIGGTALAAPFDGNWTGQIAASGRCPAATMTITVSGETLSGAVHNPGNVAPFKGSIDNDGNAIFTTEKGHPGTIKFTTSHFDANWKSGCQRHALGDRAADAAQNAALIALRKQAQATYDDLTARAANGDRSVDFTKLRASYPFTKQWGHRGTSEPLLEQAKVAAEGKDCVTAMEKLDEVLKIDYTIIAAHRLRSNCLKGTPARIESRISGALMASLRHSGSGRNEQSAYQVMTMHEESDILADRRIVLKSRDIQVRGSDGRFYDVVHGISLGGGVIQIQNVYFNVTAQVNGRSSAMAATDAVRSALP